MTPRLILLAFLFLNSLVNGQQRLLIALPFVGDVGVGAMAHFSNKQQPAVYELYGFHVSPVKLALEVFPYRIDVALNGNIYFGDNNLDKYAKQFDGYYSTNYNLYYSSSEVLGSQSINLAVSKFFRYEEFRTKQIGISLNCRVYSENEWTGYIMDNEIDLEPTFREMNSSYYQNVSYYEISSAMTHWSLGVKYTEGVFSGWKGLGAEFWIAAFIQTPRKYNVFKAPIDNKKQLEFVESIYGPFGWHIQAGYTIWLFRNIQKKSKFREEFRE